MKWNEISKEHCSVARTLAAIGDRWTLMLLRDCFLGIRRFEDFQARLGIPKTTLSERLRRLVDADILRLSKYSERPPRAEYRLTTKGHDLYPVILAIADWGNRHTMGTNGPPLIHTHKLCGHDFEPVTTCSCCRQKVGARDVEVRAGPALSMPPAFGQLGRSGSTQAD